MGGEWRRLSLAEAGVRLIDCEHRTPPPVEAGYPYVTIPNLRGGRIVFDGARLISRDHFVEWTRRALPRQFDVVLSRRCNPGETAAVPAGVDFALGQNLVLLRSDGTAIHPPFLRWLARGLEWREQVERYLNVGAIFDSLRCSDVPRFELTVPPPLAQVSIAEFLDALDDKIELNRRTNETLEAMARALFKSWFVDFDPVRAKAEGRAPAGMDAATAALFPSELVDSELGPIPKGWRCAALASCMDINPPRRLPKGEPAPYVEMANLPVRGHRPLDWPDREVGSGARFRNGDVLLARITPCLENGKTGLVDFLDDGQVAWGSTEYIVLSPRGTVPSAWVYLLARDPAFREFAVQSMEGSTGRQRVSADALGRYRVTLGSDNVFLRFGEIVGPFFQRMGALHDECRTLAALRDALLPRLLSGELDVSGLEAAGVADAS